MLPALHTMDEAAEHLRVSRRTLQGLIQEHPFYRQVGRKKLFTDVDLLKLIEALGGGGLMAVTLEIGPNGSTVMVEPVLRKGLTRRVFRYMADGSLEWAAYDDWRSQHERARFFGFASRELPASMTS